MAARLLQPTTMFPTGWFHKKSMKRLVSWECNVPFQHKYGYIKNMFSRLLRHQAWKWSGSILVEWEGMEKQENRRSE